MDDKQSNRRLSSILKRAAAETSPPVRIGRRISFSEKQSVKKFREGAETVTEWEDSYEEKAIASSEATRQPSGGDEKENYMDLTGMLDTKATASSSSSNLGSDMDFSVINSVKTDVNCYHKPMNEVQAQREIVMLQPQNLQRIRSPHMTRAKSRQAKRESNEMDISDNTAGNASLQPLTNAVETILPESSPTQNDESAMLISPEKAYEFLGTDPDLKVTSHIFETEDELASAFNQNTIHFNEQIDTIPSEGTVMPNIEQKAKNVYCPIEKGTHVADQTQIGKELIVLEEEIAYNQRMDQLLCQDLSKSSIEFEEDFHGYTLNVDRTSYIMEKMQEDSLDLGDFNTESFENRIILNQTKIFNQTIAQELETKQDFHEDKPENQTQIVNDSIVVEEIPYKQRTDQHLCLDLRKSSIEFEEECEKFTQIVDRTSYISEYMQNNSLEQCSPNTDTFEERYIAQELDTKQDFHEYEPKINRTSYVPGNMDVNPTAQYSFKTESFEKHKIMQTQTKIFHQTITQELETEPKHDIAEFHMEFTSTKFSPKKALLFNEFSNDSNDMHLNKSNLIDDSKFVDFTMPFCSTRLPGVGGDFSQYNDTNINDTSNNCLKDLSLSVPTQSGVQSCNTDDLCQLNAEQIFNKGANSGSAAVNYKTIDTAMQSLHLSGMNRQALELSSGPDEIIGLASNPAEPPKTRQRRSSDYRCRKCKNCSRSIGSTSSVSSGSLLQHDPLGDTTCLNAYKLDFSMYNRLANTATVHNVVQAFAKRRQAEEAANKAVVDQKSPGFLFLFDNKQKQLEEEKLKTQPVIKEERIRKCIFPSTINAEFAIDNKLSTDISNFTYMDRYFYQGTIILRNKYIPSVMLYMEFMPMRLLTEKPDRISFCNIYTMLCPHQTAILSPIDTLRHNELLSKLPSDLITLCPTGNRLSSFIEVMDSYYCAAYKLVTEMNHIAIINDTYLRRENGEIFLQKIVHLQERNMQKFVLDVHNMNTIGPQHVFTKPARMLSPVLNTLPVGLPFLKTFLSDPMQYLA